MLSDAVRDEILALAERYPEGRQKSAVMPALFVAQESVGWLPPEVLNEVAELLRLPHAHVTAVATFYTMFEKQPTGEHLLDVCCGASCMLCGSYDILNQLAEKLGIGFGETTPDGKITLREQECIGACAHAPVLQVDYHFREDVTPEMLDDIIAALRGTDNQNG